MEIGLSYTSLIRIDQTIVTVPNSNLINANLLNYNISVTKERKKDEERKKEEQKRLTLTSGVSIGLPDVLTNTMIQSLSQDEIVRYSLKIDLKLNQFNPPLLVKDVKERLNEVCKEFEPLFGFKPTYYFGSHVFRQDTHFVITAKDTNALLDNYDEFMEAIMVSVFKELQ